jgi:hypothetical protein
VKWRTFYDTTLAVPWFITWKSNLPAMWVYSNKLIDPNTERQTYVIELTGSILLTDMNPTYTEVQKFTIVIVNTCPDDVLTNVRHTFVDYIYYIGENTETNVYTYSASKP